MSSTILISVAGVIVIGLLLYIWAIKRSGATALHLAAAHDKFAEVFDLLTSGADPNAKDSRGRTPLHQAIMSGSPEVVDLLLSGGSEPNLPDKNGEISLHHVSSRRVLSGTGEIITALFRHGADPATQNIYGVTPYVRASELGRDLIAEAIKQKMETA